MDRDAMSLRGPLTSGVARTRLWPFALLGAAGAAVFAGSARRAGVAFALAFVTLAFVTLAFVTLAFVTLAFVALAFITLAFFAPAFFAPAFFAPAFFAPAFFAPAFVALFAGFLAAFAGFFFAALFLFFVAARLPLAAFAVFFEELFVPARFVRFLVGTCFSSGRG